MTTELTNLIQELPEDIRAKFLEMVAPIQTPAEPTPSGYQLPREVLNEIYALESAEEKAERLKRLKEYNAAEHISEWEKYDKTLGRNVLIRYYPAAWRLYELRMRYPYSNFSTDLIFYDAKTDFCIIRARLFLGPEYAPSPKKAEAFKQGKLSMLDKIETAAKARAARDFGIGTEYALDIEDGAIDAELAQKPGRAQNNRPAPAKNSQPAPSAQQQNKRPAPAPAPAKNSQPTQAPSAQQQNAQKPAPSAPASQDEPDQKPALETIPKENVLKADFQGVKPTALRNNERVQLTWYEFLRIIFKDDIKAGKINAGELKKRELTPDECAYVDLRLQPFREGAKQNAA